MRQQLTGLLVKTGGTADALPEVIAEHRYAGVEQATDFEVLTTSGEVVRLTDLRGRVVLLNFWSYG